MLLSRFFQDRRASILPIFALAIIPVIGFVGAAVDYTRASTARTELQAALDAAALMIFRDAATSTPTQLDQKAFDAVAAQFQRKQTQVPVVKVTYTTNPNTVSVTGSSSVQSAFMGLIGVSQIDIKASSTVTWGFSKLRVALALDNTGSMADAGKIDALKTATKNLLTTLRQTEKKPGDVQVSIVPFSKDVNVGSSNYTANWLDWSMWNAPATSSCWSGWCWNGRSWVQQSSLRSSWNGCVSDRGTSTGPYQNYDVTNAAPATNDSGTLFPAEQYAQCPTALLPLGYDWTALNAKVDAMAPAGSTNQTIGLVWAWHSLTPGSPLNAPPLDPKVSTQQYIILLSDGLNTQDRWYGDGANVSAQVDARMAAVCTNAKAAGIQIYTVQVNTGGDPTSKVLQNCASSPDKFFELKSATAMVSTFNQIAVQLTTLRISK